MEENKESKKQAWFFGCILALVCALGIAGESVQYRAVTGNVVLTKDDADVNATSLASATTSITLPAAAAWGANIAGRIVVFRSDTGNNLLSISSGGGDTINGLTSIALVSVTGGSGKLCHSNGVTAWSCQ